MPPFSRIMVVMGIFRDNKDAPESLDLRRPKIPKSPPLPQIRGPRGGLAYEPHPRDRSLIPEAPKPATKKLTGRVAVSAGPKAEVGLPVMPMTLAASLVATVNYLAHL
jgi:hypothetical protein